MEFYMPAKVYFEHNCVAAHGAEMASFGKKALIVTGRHSAEANGSLADVKAALENSGTAWCHFNEVEENPSVDTVMKARDFGLAGGADFVIGIGGGSPMDAAKAIALMLRHPEGDRTYLYDRNAEGTALPVVEVPTTCGTGSEVTAVSVLTRKELRTKGSIPHRIFPNLSLIDGKYLKTASPKVLADTSMDALAHLMESQINSKTSVISRMCSEAGLKKWGENRGIVLAAVRNGENQLGDEEAMSLMAASFFGGMAIAHTGTSVPHGLSYSLTINAHMAHGKACGYFLPGYLAEADPADAKYALNLAGFESADALEEYYEAACGRDKVDPAFIEKSIQDILRNPAKQKAAPFKVDEAVLRRIAERY